MKRLSLFSIAVAAMLSFSAPVLADDAKPSIVVVNIQQVLKDSTAAKSVREQLESKQKEFQADISKKEEALKKESQELDKKKTVLSKTVFAEKANAFRAKATEVQKEVQDKKGMLDAAFEGSLNQIQKSVNEVIAEMAKEKGFTLAVPTSQILYSDAKMDISKEVLEQLNKKLPKLDVKFEAK